MPTRAYVVTALSNEAPYLLEWVAHYLGLGFDGAILFTHDCQDGTEGMAARLAELGHVHQVPLSLKKKQNPSRQAMRQLPEIAQNIKAEWCLAADIDEFLTIRTGDGTLSDLFDACGSVDAISVRRRPFGSSGRRGLPEGSVRDIYLNAAEEDDRGRMVTRGIKTLFRLGRVSRISPHRPYFEDVKPPITWVDGGAQPMPEAFLGGKWSAHEEFSSTHARLNYYAALSPEAFLIRRGVPADRDERKASASDWRKLNINTVSDDGMARSVALSKPFCEAFAKDTLLMEAQSKGRAWHEARAQSALKDPEIAALCAKLSDAADARKAKPARSSPRGGEGIYAPPPVRPVRFKVKPLKKGETQAVLHGGFHKTATTYLQGTLEHNQEWLGRRSVYVVPHQKLRKHITFPSQLDAYQALNIHRRTRFSEEELQGFADAFFKEPLSLIPERMILSDENISGLPAHCLMRGALYQHRKEFFRCFAKRMPLPITDAFFAIRNYADFFASSYFEYLRAATPNTTGRMMRPEEMRRNVFASLPNWKSVFDDFAEIFPDTRIHVWRFEDFSALSSQILSMLCGNGVDVAKLKPPKKRKTRASASARAIEELILISELEGAGAMAEQVKVMQEKYPQGEDYGRFDPWTALDRAHLSTLYERDWQALCADERLTTLLP